MHVYLNEKQFLSSFVTIKQSFKRKEKSNIKTRGQFIKGKGILKCYLNVGTIDLKIKK